MKQRAKEIAADITGKTAGVIAEYVNDPFGVTQVVFGVASTIYEQVLLVRANKEQFNSLSARIKVIEKSVKGLGKIPDSAKFRLALNAFKDCLEDCLSFVQEFAGKHWFKRVLSAGVHSEKFDELNKRLKQVMSDLNLGLNIQQIMNREQDKKDQEADYQDICKKQDKIIRLNQEELEHIQRLEKQQQEYHYILQRQLESMRLQIIQLNVNMKKEVLPIDPHLIIPYFDICFDKEVSKGSFGPIYLARWCEQPMVVKTLEGNFTPAERNRFIREINIMSRLRSPHIVQFYGACLESGRACLAMEYMEKGSLYDLLDRTTLTFEQQQNLALSIVLGLHYLHTKGVLHRDLKSANVLINKTGQAKLTNFGLSKVLRSTSIATLAGQKSQAIQWMAPETFSMNPTYTEQSDIYSYGVILWEIVTGRKPWAGLSDDEIIKQVSQGKREEIPATIPEIYANIIRECCVTDPKQRPYLIDIIRILERNEIRPPSPNAESLYEQGVAREKRKDYSEAFSLHQRSADKGYTKALTHLGFFHLQGLDVPQNKPQAYQCFFKAAKKGHVRAMFNLATMLEYGDGVPKDLEKALLWYKKAAEQNDQHAKKAFIRLESQINEINATLKESHLESI